MLSKNISVVAWFIMVRIGRMVMPLPTAGAHVDDEGTGPRCARFAWSRGVVRASSSIRSECSARLVQTFWPFTT